MGKVKDEKFVLEGKLEKAHQQIDHLNSKLKKKARELEKVLNSGAGTGSTLKDIVEKSFVSSEISSMRHNKPRD